MNTELHLPGADVAAGVRRCGGSAQLYLRFLKRFPSDPSLAALEQALREKDLSAAFQSAHALKGLSAQLGLTALCEPAQALCELLRAQNPASLPAAGEAFAALAPIYWQLVRNIDALP